MFAGKPALRLARWARTQAGERIKKLPVLRGLGRDAGLVPVDRAAVLGERPAVDDRARLELELGDRHFQPHPLLRGRQVADPEPLGRAVGTPVDHVLAPVRAVRPAPLRVPLEHQLRGRIRRVDINISKQRVAGADLELAPGVVEEPLIEPLGRDCAARGCR